MCSHSTNNPGSDTTRQPRAGEQDGKDYYFTTKEDFQRLVEEKGFIEHAQFGGNSYGTSVKTVQNVAEQGRICILDIEMEVGVPLPYLDSCLLTRHIRA